MCSINPILVNKVFLQLSCLGQSKKKLFFQGYEKPDNQRPIWTWVSIKYDDDFWSVYNYVTLEQNQ